MRWEFNPPTPLNQKLHTLSVHIFISDQNDLQPAKLVRLPVSTLEQNTGVSQYHSGHKAPLDERTNFYISVNVVGLRGGALGQGCSKAYALTATNLATVTQKDGWMVVRPGLW